MHKGVVSAVGLLAMIVALLMLQLTSPSVVGPFGVLAFFVLIYVVSACVVYLLLVGSIGLLRRYLPKGKWLLRLESLSNRKLYYYTSFVALAPVILLGMQSIGSVRPTDLLLLLIFQVLGCFYISRRF